MTPIRLTLGLLVGALSALLLLTLHGLHLALDDLDSDTPYDPTDPMEWPA